MPVTNIARSRTTVAVIVAEPMSQRRRCMVDKTSRSYTTQYTSVYIGPRRCGPAPQVISRSAVEVCHVVLSEPGNCAVMVRSACKYLATILNTSHARPDHLDTPLLHCASAGKHPRHTIPACGALPRSEQAHELLYQRLPASQVTAAGIPLFHEASCPKLLMGVVFFTCGADRGAPERRVVRWRRESLWRWRERGRGRRRYPPARVAARQQGETSRRRARSRG